MEDVIQKIKPPIARALKHHIVVQFSPPRTGSTLVYNILREIFFFRRFVKKRHKFRDSYLAWGWPLVITYRHPLDCVASAIFCSGHQPEDQILDEKIAELDQRGIWDLPRIKDHPRVLLLRYEEFQRDYDRIYTELERFFKIHISTQRRHRLNAKYGLPAIEKKIADKASFEEYDAVTLYHGRHISKFKGRPYYYREVFNRDQQRYLYDHYRTFIEQFGYPAPDQAT